MVLVSLFSAAEVKHRLVFLDGNDSMPQIPVT